MPLVGSFILPHGALLLDPTKPEYDDELHQAMRQAARDVASLRPDVLLLSTPHGLAHSTDFGLYLNHNAEGSAGWFGQYEEYKVRVTLDCALTTDLHRRLQVPGLRVSGVTAFAPAVAAPLGWGEVVPLWFLERALRESSAATRCSGSEPEQEQQLMPRCVILSQPTRRHEQVREMEQELRRLGQAISAFFQERSERVVVVISGDLAHTHSREPSAPYAYSATAEPFGVVLLLFEKTLSHAGIVLY